MWPDKKFVAVIIILLGIISVALFLSNDMMQAAIPSEETCQNIGPAGVNINYNWCDCETHLVCANEWDHNCRVMEEKIECHLNKTLAERWNRVKENMSGMVET